MKTTYYTYTTWDSGALAAGFDGGAERAALVCQSRSAGGDNVVDFNAWRAARLAEELRKEETVQEADCAWEEEPAQPEELEPVQPRPRRDHHSRALFTAELLSTLAVAGAAAALMVRVLLF